MNSINHKIRNTVNGNTVVNKPSLRRSARPDAWQDNPLGTTPEFRCHVAEKLDQLLDVQLNVDHMWQTAYSESHDPKPGNTNIELVKGIPLTLARNARHHNPPVRKRTISSSSSSSEENERLKEAAISTECILAASAIHLRLTTADNSHVTSAVVRQPTQTTMCSNATIKLSESNDDVHLLNSKRKRKSEGKKERKRRKQLDANKQSQTDKKTTIAKSAKNKPDALDCLQIGHEKLVGSCTDPSEETHKEKHNITSCNKNIKKRKHLEKNDHMNMTMDEAVNKEFKTSVKKHKKNKKKCEI